eukprot:66364-Prorocentrum_minimum.AAC.1
MQSGLPTSSGKSPLFVSGTHAAGCVSVQVGSQTGAWFPPAQRAQSEGLVSVRPACRPTLGPIQASCL